MVILAASIPRSRRIVHAPLAIKLSPIALLISSSALAANWVPLGTDARGNAWHIDVASVAEDRGDFTVWKRIDFSPPLVHFQTRAPIKKAFIFSATSCELRKTDVRAMGFLDPEGSIVNIYGNGSESIPWPPGAHAALLDNAMNVVCGGKQRKTGNP